MASDKILIELDVEPQGGVDGLEKVDKEVNTIGKSAKKTETGVKKFGKTLSNLGKAAGIIGLISFAIGVLQEAFQNNQKVMDVFSNVTTSLGIIVNDLFNFIIDNAGTVVDFFKDIFENPLDSIKALGEAFKNNIIERFESFLDTLGFLSDALIKVFKGDFAGAMDSAKEAGKEWVDVMTGVDGTVDKVVEGVGDLIDATIEYTTETYKAAEAITAQTKSLRLLELQQTRIREASDRDAEQQRQIRDDVTKGIDERIEANERLAVILDEQQKAEQKTVSDRIAALQNQQSQLGFNQERLEQIYELQTELIAIEAQQAGFRSEQLINENGLLQEKTDLLGFQTQAELDQFLIIEAANKELTDADRLEKVEVDAAKAKAKAEEAAKANSIAAAGEVLNAVSGFAGEGTEAAKGFALGQVAIDVARGLVGALSGWSNLGPFGIAGAVASSAAIVAAGALAVKNITSVTGKTTSVPPSVTSTASVANVSPPTFQTQADTGLNQLGDTISGALNNGPVQAWVSSSDISTAQQFDRLTQNNTTL